MKNETTEAVQHDQRAPFGSRTAAVTRRGKTSSRIPQTRFLGSFRVNPSLPYSAETCGLGPLAPVLRGEGKGEGRTANSSSTLTLSLSRQRERGQSGSCSSSSPEIVVVLPE
jgi:hypothetical protein